MRGILTNQSPVGGNGPHGVELEPPLSFSLSTGLVEAFLSAALIIKFGEISKEPRLIWFASKYFILNNYEKSLFYSKFTIDNN